MTETAPKYNREEIYGDKREQVKQEISKDKEKLKYDTKTPEWKAKLSEAWMNRAHLSGAQKEHIYQKLGFQNTPDLKTEAWQREFTMAVEKWQKDPENRKKHGGTIGKADGILGWATLEALDSDDQLKQIPEKADTNSDIAQQEVDNFLTRLSHQQRLEDAQQLLSQNELSEWGKTLLYSRLESDSKIWSKWVATKFKEWTYQLSEQSNSV